MKLDDTMLASIKRDKNTETNALVSSFYLQKLLEHDPYTYYHSIRVGCLMSAFSDFLGYSKDISESLYFAGLLHDIGKLYVSKEVLNKKGKLNSDEWNLIRAHPKQGIKLLTDSLTDPIYYDVIRYHHENLDGSGYPFQLMGEQIPNHARIARIVDTFDAMTTDRSYNKKRSVNTAIHTIESQSGQSFDKELSSEFIDFAYTLI